MKHPIQIVSLVLILLSFGPCLAEEAANRKFESVRITCERPHPTIDFTTYVLITKDSRRDRKEAEEIARRKGIMPRAVQTKDRKLFESVLAREFTFRGENVLFDRKAYIDVRVASKENVHKVRYENVALQVFGDSALMTYRNVLDHANEDGSEDSLHFTWAQRWVKEDGLWKVSAYHLIDQRVEPKPRNANKAEQGNR